MFKKMIYLLTVVCVVFASCDCTPVISGPKPFVVQRVSEIGDNMCEYFGDHPSGYDGTGFSGKPSIVLPCRMYNIGDTINFKK